MQVGSGYILKKLRISAVVALATAVLILSPETLLATDLVNINTADGATLQTLSGIGSSKAAAIIEYRQTNGNFAVIEDIQNVSGIGPSTFENIKPYITVGLSGSSQSATVDDSGDTTEKVSSTEGGSKVNAEPPVPVGSLMMAVPKIAYVDQLIAFLVEPKEGTDERLIRYTWNFGDASTATTKTPTHSYLYPGTYVVTVQSYYAKEETAARSEITILPVALSLLRTVRGDIQITNRGKYEIDLSNFVIRGDMDFSIPQNTIILPDATLTISKSNVEQGVMKLIFLYDSSGVLVASSMPYVQKEANAAREKAVVLNTSKIEAPDPLPNDTGALKPEKQEAAFVSQNNTATNTKPAGNMVYAGLLGVLLTGTLGVLIRKG